MLTMILVILAVIAMYFIIGMIGIMVWEVTTEIKGVFDTPNWLHKVYNFITEKWFFFYN